MLMPLKFKPPPPDDVTDVVPAEQELTQGAIDRLHAKIEAFIDQLVAEEKARCPNQPVQVIRGIIMRGLCPCAAARRILEQR
jgi:hypothetical protein